MLRVRALAAGILCLLPISGSLFGQSQVATAALRGTITDPSGAAVVGAQVTARNMDTGFVRGTTSTGAGLYNLMELPVGTYELTVKSNSFTTTQIPGIKLSVGAAATLDISLQIGTSTATVTVTSEVPLVEAARSETSTTVSTRQVESLPINRRNF